MDAILVFGPQPLAARKAEHGCHEDKAPSRPPGHLLSALWDSAAAAPSLPACASEPEPASSGGNSGTTFNQHPRALFLWDAGDLPKVPPAPLQPPGPTPHRGEPLAWDRPLRSPSAAS